jgi:UDP-2-acetamido-3-amino-2,3-dideoxy-glucuronate N-acetyltransferase
MTGKHSPSFVHPHALVETQEIGEGTRIWAFTHVLAGAAIGRNCNIGDHCFIEGSVRVGDNVTIKNGSMLWDGVTIEDGVFIGPGAIFTNDQYPRSPRLEEARERYATRDWLVPTHVRHGATIGAGATILAGTTIGRFALVAARALVTRDVPDHAVARGMPARVSGWVCRCGWIVPEQPETATCPECGLAFEQQNDGVVRWDEPA